MNSNRHLWQVWARALHRLGITEVAASILDSCGPITILGAQAIYLCQPLVPGSGPGQHLESLANMLDNSTETRAFIEYLREGGTP